MTTLFISHSSKDKAWAKRTHTALWRGGYQGVFLDSDSKDGIHLGANWEQTIYQRLRDCRGVVVLCSANWLASSWCVAEAIIARAQEKPVFLIASADVADDRQGKAAGDKAAPLIPNFLKDRQFLSLGQVTEEEAFRLLLDGLSMEGLKKLDFKPVRPYPGLEAFQEEDAAVYFGRDAEADKVIASLNRRRHNNALGFIVVLGASGSGKSSLVQAGVLPRLRRASSCGSVRSPWVIVPTFKGRTGVKGLALSLESAFDATNRPQDLGTADQWLSSASELCDLGRELLLVHKASAGSVLLVLDQLEEVFGPKAAPEARTLLRLLLDATADPTSQLVVLATMRSDFLNDFQQFDGASGRYEEITLDPMLRSRFGEVIAGPAKQCELELDAGLAERMADETTHNDALPLLAFTLSKLYERSDGKRLTLKAYDDLGGVTEAIKIEADAILKDLGYAGRLAEDPLMRDLRRAFYSMAQVGEEGQFTRRIASWSEMPASCERILLRFVDSRLLVSGAANGERVLGVAHEALFRVWDTLRDWLQEGRKALALRTQIEESAAEWHAADRARSRAWPEERVLEAVRQIEDVGVSLTDVPDCPTVVAFLGPIRLEQLIELPKLGAQEDAEQGSGSYGKTWNLPLGHEARASAGVRIALLGDPRPGVGLRDGVPDIDWCQVRGGKVKIDIHEIPNNPLSKIVREIEHDVEDFHIARYPVTVGQFQAFVHECHDGTSWNATFLDPQSQDLAEVQRQTESVGNIRCPVAAAQFQALSRACYEAGLWSALFRDHRYAPPRHRAAYTNHPADNLNWYDAMAFCGWLSKRLGYEVRLPTEFEWQLAVTGGDLTQVCQLFGLLWHGHDVTM